MRLLPLVLLMLLSLALLGCDNSSSYESSTIWNDPDESQEELQVTQEELDEAYAEGWDNAVSDVFSDHDDLYNDDQQYVSDDYYGQGNQSSYAETLEDAEQEGYESAVEEVFSDTDVLSYGEDHYYVDDYE